MADRTGLEPATSGVTGQHSNQLNYRSVKQLHTAHCTVSVYSMIWWVVRDLNPRHSPCKGDALPTELTTQRRREAHFTDLALHVNKDEGFRGIGVILYRH